MLVYILCLSSEYEKITFFAQFSTELIGILSNIQILIQIFISYLTKVVEILTYAMSLNDIKAIYFLTRSALVEAQSSQEIES
jgi:hypothetical protein